MSMYLGQLKLIASQIVDKEIYEGRRPYAYWGRSTRDRDVRRLAHRLDRMSEDERHNYLRSALPGKREQAA